MSAKDFKFVSPGVYIEEIDNSQVPRSPIAIGPLVIGRSRRGPAFQPVRVDSFSEFITIFGNPVAGEEASDLWRGGVPTAPTFAAYAAQAWLKNSSPLTFIRLLGEQSPDQDGTAYAQAGWKSSNVIAPAASADQGGGAYGLFLFNSSSLTTESVDGTLAAIFYVTEGAVTLSGSIRGRLDGDTEVPNLATTTGSAAMVYSGDGTYNVQFYNKDETLQEEAVINMDRTNQNYIRKVLNTNPTLTNSALVDSTSASQKKYWLGQTFEREVSNKITSSAQYGMILRLGRSTSDISNAGDYKFSSQAARTGWFFSQDIRSTAANTGDTSKNIPSPMYDPASLSGVTRLFRLHGLSAGEDVHRNFKVCIEDVKYSSNDNTPYGSFTLAIRDIKDSDNSVRYVERYANLSLDPNSPNYIAKQIGDRYHEWDTNQRRLIEYGSYENRSSIFRVEMADAVDQSQTDPELLPFGVEGPIKFGDFQVVSIEEATETPSTATVGVADGDDNTYTATVGQKITIESTDGTKVDYFVANTNAGGPAANVVVEAGDDLGGGTLATLTAGATGISIGYDFSSLPTQNAQLVILKAAIENANGHNGKILVSNVPAEANGAQTITLTQAADGTAGDNTITEDIAVFTTVSGFAGGADDSDVTVGYIANSAGAGPDSPVSAGSGSSGIFMAASSSNDALNTSTAVLLQYNGRTTGLGDVPFTGSVSFPSIPLRVSASDGDLGDSTEAYFGPQFARAASSVVFEESNFDITYPVAKASAFAPSTTAAGGLVTSWYFSLDDLVAKYKSDADARDVVFYSSGSRSTGGSVTAISGSYKKILDMGYDRFSAAFYGGFDGFDIAEKEPFNASRAMQHGTATELNSAMFYSAKKAVDMFSDPEYIESNILTFPGMINEGITTHMITTCESRGDAFALIDPRGGYEPASENYESEQTRIVTGLGRGGVARHVTDVADKMDARNLNSSYGAVYYPWVRITDTITGRNLWAPPSLAAFGAMAYSEKQSALWFAPAGFNRGGLTEGAAGLPVTNVRSRLTSKERDYLYERNINPIASFPNEGIVIFGQKTLQITPSALDRINVRRLMIFVKKEISRIASQLLFDQNVEQTWSRFTGQVNPFLTNIKNNFGLDAFKVILDETTTTPDLIDRNTIYAKIFLKPTKAVEFFAIDFVITNSGAGFED